MAKEPDTKSEATDESSANGGGPRATLWMLMLLVAGGAGFAIPFLLPVKAPADAADSKPQTPFEQLKAEDTLAIPFGEVTVNLDEGRMNRYLRLKISVLIAKQEELTVTAAIAAKSAVLKNWLLSHLSDKGLEEIRGKAGLNMLRREICREFNETLFSDRRDRVFDVLFEEFNVQ